MRTSRALILAAGSGLLLAGCGSISGGVTTTAVTSTAATSGASHAAASASAAAKAGLGSAINLNGVNAGDEIQVTVVKVVDPDTSTDGFSSPSAGNRYVSVEFQIVDNGKNAYKDDPQIDATVKDAAGHSFQVALLGGNTAAGPQMDSSTNLAPGDKALGYITFEVPTGDQVAVVQYGLNGGMFGAVGEWQVG